MEERQALAPRQPRCLVIADRLLSVRKMEKFETWNVSTLQGVGKTEQLTMEMEPYRLSVLAVTERHLAGEDEMVLDECRGHKMLFSGTGREYGRTVEG